MAMTPEASGVSSAKYQADTMLSSLRRVADSRYGKNCRFDGGVGFLYAARIPAHLPYLPQYVRYLVKSRVTAPHTILIMRSLLDISTDMDVATRVLIDLKSLEAIDDIFVSDISEQLPFADYVGDIRKYYGLPETMKPLRLRMPEAIVTFADRMQSQGLPYSDITDTLLVTKSQIQAYRKKYHLGKTYTSYYRNTLNEEQRSRFREECRAMIAKEFDMRFSSRKLTLLGNFSIAHTIYGMSKMLKQ